MRTKLLVFCVVVVIGIGTGLVMVVTVRGCEMAAGQVPQVEEFVGPTIHKFLTDYLPRGCVLCLMILVVRRWGDRSGS